MTDTSERADLAGIDPSLVSSLLVSYSTVPLPGETPIETERRRRRELNAQRDHFEVGVQIDDLELAGVHVRRYQAVSEPSGWLVWAHGGGWVYGDAGDDQAMLAEFSRTGRGVLAVDYRLAPEHPFPAALDDIVSVASTVEGPLLLGGASAGGALAAGAALRFRDRGNGVDGLFLVCPALDDRIRADDEAWLTRDQMDVFWRDYLGANRTGLYAAPARAESLEGLPRTYIATTTADPLREEAWDFGRRLAAAAIPVTMEHLPGGYHGFEYEAPDADFTRRAIAQWADLLARWTR